MLLVHHHRRLQYRRDATRASHLISLLSISIMSDLPSDSSASAVFHFLPSWQPPDPLTNTVTPNTPQEQHRTKKLGRPKGSGKKPRDDDNSQRKVGRPRGSGHRQIAAREAAGREQVARATSRHTITGLVSSFKLQIDVLLLICDLARPRHPHLYDKQCARYPLSSTYSPNPAIHVCRPVLIHGR